MLSIDVDMPLTIRLPKVRRKDSKRQSSAAAGEGGGGGGGEGDAASLASAMSASSISVKSLGLASEFSNGAHFQSVHCTIMPTHCLSYA